MAERIKKLIAKSKRDLKLAKDEASKSVLLANIEVLTDVLKDFQKNPPKKRKKRMTKKQREKERIEALPDRKEGIPTEISPKKLQPHQQAFIKNFLKSPVRGAMAIHGVGSGKTLTAVVSAEMYLKDNPTHKVIVITPASLLGNFKQELYEYDPAIEKDKRYKFFTYDGYSRAYTKADEEADCKKAMLIVDEGQNLRTMIRKKEAVDLRKLKDTGVLEKKETIVSGKRVLNILKGCGMEADKILILSATPLVNSPQDIENLMAIINGHEPLDPKSFPFNKLWQDPKLSAKYFGCRLSFFNQPQAVLDKFYPKVQEMFVPIVMNRQTKKDYEEIEKVNITSKKLKKEFKIGEDDSQDKLKAFYNGLRRASNALEGEKSQKVNFIIDWIKSVIAKKPNKKLGLTKKMIDTHTDKSVIFTHFMGAGTDLIIKRLKEEGIPYGAINGKVPRGQRAKIVKRYVDGEDKVILISKAGAEGLNLLETGYMFLVEPSWNNTEVEQVKGRGVRFKSHTSLPKKLQNVLILSLFLIKPSEKKQFMNLINAQDKRDKDDAMLIPSKIQEELKERLSIDLFLYNKSNAKQAFLDKVLKELKKIESVEDCKSDKKFLDISGLFELKRVGGKKLPELTKWEKDFYNSKSTDEELKEISDIHKSKQEGELTMRQLSEKMKAITRSVFGGNKALVQSQNAFFTPPLVAEDMIKFSGIGETKHDILFLEPTAGAGYIMYQALKASKKVYADGLENLKPLAEFLDDFPRTEVLPQRNYFDLPNDKKYRVILMNPPFNLSKGKGLSRSTKDVDFVMSAFKNHLADEGILVCIISNAYEFRGKDPKRKTDRKIYQPFRDLLATHEHKIIEYETGFSKGAEKGVIKEQETGVRMRMIKILKK